MTRNDVYMPNFFFFFSGNPCAVVHMLTSSMLVLYFLVLYFLTLEKNDCAFSSWDEMFHFRLPDTTLQQKFLEKPKIELTVQCGRNNTPMNDRELNHLR